MTTIALFNNKRGVGRTTLTYHLAHMVARLGWRVLAIDLDPQADLTCAFFDEDDRELFWEPESDHTVFKALAPFIRRLDDLELPETREVEERLWMIPGDLGLSTLEHHFADAWQRGLLGDEGAIRVTAAFHRVIHDCSRLVNADVVLVDVGPNLGAMSRSALLATDCLVIPLTADVFSLQSLRYLGSTLREWRQAWHQLDERGIAGDVPVDLPVGRMQTIGYTLVRRALRLDQPVRDFDRWLSRVPAEFHRSVLGERDAIVTSASDPFQLASLRSYRSLVPLAEDARKPMFNLRAADGALGSTARLVQDCYLEHRDLALRVMAAAEIPTPAAL